MAPNAAVPNEAPIIRKNVDALVAAPMCAGSTSFCTISTSTCMTLPNPMPSTKAARANSQ